MPRGRVLTAETKKKILKLIVVGLTDGEIAAALKISSDVVHKMRKNTGGKKDVGEPENHSGFKQKTRARGDQDPDRNKPQEKPGESRDRSENNIPAGETITFTGGKKHKQNGGSETMNKNEKEEFEYECPACHHQWNGSPAECPKCGKLLQE